ncbi:MAG: DegT/DnrJ/EryC1/StrS family aminotransferase [Armatimonadetes bacterium]|nr:DegT/DnrJ/EryC1/StrS family aminotransferase [Armatimonadota bacterium]
MTEKLAMDGGTPARSRTEPPMYPGAMEIAEEEKRAVCEVLDEKILFRYHQRPSGPGRVEEFEERLGRHLGAAHVLAVNSGTSALISALVAAGIGPGDEVIIPAYTFVATPAAVIAAKAIPIIAEVDDSLTLDPDDFEEKITDRTRAVIPVHMRGAPSDMGRLMEIANAHDLRVIEDSAQAVGASYKGQRLGTIGHAGCFSLQMSKVITSGEGGVLITSDSGLYDRARMYHDAAVRFWDQDAGMRAFPGVNFRMSEVAGALALVQLSRMEGLIERMRANKAAIKSALEPREGMEFRRIHDDRGEASLCLIFYLPDAALAKRFGEALRAEGIGSGTIYDQGIPDRHIYTAWAEVLAYPRDVQKGCPFTCPMYKGSVRYSSDMCPRTLDYLGRTIHINVSPMLTPDDCAEIALGINKVAAALL